MTIPYQEATSGGKARDEITKILQRFGCESVGFMDDFSDGSVLLAFKHRGRQVHLRASAKGWAELWLQENPWNSRRSLREKAYREKAVSQGLVAVNSVIRDWVKGQVTAVETGIMSFEAVFMPHMLTDNGQTMVERVMSLNLLPPPQ